MAVLDGWVKKKMMHQNYDAWWNFAQVGKQKYWNLMAKLVGVMLLDFYQDIVFNSSLIKENCLSNIQIIQEHDFRIVSLFTIYCQF